MATPWLGACVWAQVPPEPAAPPAPPAPVAAPSAPVPPAAPLPPEPPPAPAWDGPLGLGPEFKFRMENVQERVQEVMRRLERTPLLSEDKLRAMQERLEADQDRLAARAAESAERLALAGRKWGDHALLQGVWPAPAPMPVSPKGAFLFQRDGGRDEHEYRRGTQALDRREWKEAADAFRQVAERRGTRADGALYWRAYALHKLGQRDDAVASLADLQKSFPNSRWRDDAKALEAEVRQGSGRAVTPEQEVDDDLRLIALNGLMSSDPERAIPLISKTLAGRNSPKVKERALFVLAQSQSPKAREAVIQLARGGGNPDLQHKAIEYLGLFGGVDSRQALSDLYGSLTDVESKQRVLRALFQAQDKGRLLGVARSEANPELRRSAIRNLGMMNAQAELVQLYGAEGSPEVKKAIIEGLFLSNASDRIIEIARTEKDDTVRSEAIRRLGSMDRRAGVTEALAGLYRANDSREVRRQVIRSLFQLDDPKPLITIARQETDPELKKALVQRLASMKSREATEYLMEILNKE